jgi:hypothetical protein
MYNFWIVYTPEGIPVCGSIDRMFAPRGVCRQYDGQTFTWKHMYREGYRMRKIRLPTCATIKHKPNARSHFPSGSEVK